MLGIRGSSAGYRTGRASILVIRAGAGKGAIKEK